MKRKKLLMVLCLFPAAVILYIILHESGHAMVMLLAGSRITEFSIMQAHVSYEGGCYTDYMAMWRDANGTLFPLLVSFICMLFYNSRKAGRVYHMISLYMCLIPIGSLLAWVFIPVLYIHSKATAADDATKFLNVFSWYGSPVLVSFAALVLIMAVTVLFVKKGIFLAVIRAVTAERTEGE